MAPNPLLGLLLIGIGAFSAGSFAVPFGRVRNWNWENYWLVAGVASFILAPLAACLLLAPDFLRVYADIPATRLWWVFFLGALYGIGSLTFGLSMRYLGLSLGYALALGLQLVIGTLLPPLLDGRLREMILHAGGSLLLWGIGLALIGIAFTAWAGYLRDKTVSTAVKQESVKDFNYVKGILAALLTSITGSAMSMGLEAGNVVRETAIARGTDPLFAENPLLLLVLSGTFVTTLVWCLFLAARNRSVHNFYRKERNSLPVNYLFSLLAGALWYVQFFFFGMGKSKMGPYTFTSWGILMALIIVFATLWGLYRREWQGATRGIYVRMFIGLLIITASAVVIGISGAV